MRFRFYIVKVSCFRNKENVFKNIQQRIQINNPSFHRQESRHILGKKMSDINLRFCDDNSISLKAYSERERKKFCSSFSLENLDNYRKQFFSTLKNGKWEMFLCFCFFLGKLFFKNHPSESGLRQRLTLTTNKMLQERQNQTTYNTSGFKISPKK